MNRFTQIAGGAAIFATFFFGTNYILGHASTTVEPNTLRPGGFRMSVKQTMTNDDCAKQCAEDDNCVTWNRVNNNFQRPEMICYLQNKPVETTKNDCCTSGSITRGIRSFF